MAEHIKNVFLAQWKTKMVGKVSLISVTQHSRFLSFKDAVILT